MLVFVGVLFGLFASVEATVDLTAHHQHPQQVHLSFGRNVQEIVVTWTTHQPTNVTVVRFGFETERILDRIASGNWTLFVDGGELRRRHYIHRVLLTNLLPFQYYRYQCGDGNLWSQKFRFKSLSNDDLWSPRLIVYGDLGLLNGRSIPRLNLEVNNGTNVDAILHVGDFGYDLDSNNSYIGDEFMRQMEPIAAQIPYQTSPGNHEYKYNFSNYVNRFSMFDMMMSRSKQDEPGDLFTSNINNHFYTFHLGPAQFISFSTEFYYFVEYGISQIYNQYRWLEEALIEANMPQNRKLRPWIITVGHRPMYCNNRNFDDCTRSENLIRKGIPFVHTFGLEDLFYKYGVDVEIWAHEHSYERLWPVYDRKVFNGSESEPYRNPSAPVHIITGSAGCQEDLDKFVKNPNPWSAARISDYGYTRMHIKNGTHLFFEQVSDDKNGTIVDSFVLIQEKHSMRQI